MSISELQNGTIKRSIELMNLKRLEFNTMTIPTAKWKVFRECNYQCPYCTVWQNRSEDPSSDLASAYAAAVSEAIPSSWRVYLTGGELTVRKRTTESIIRQLTESGHEIRIISNFSAPIKYYLRLFEMSQGLLKSIFLTRHRENANIISYTDKVRDLRTELPSSCKLLVRQVVETTREGIQDFLQCRRLLADTGVELYPLRLVLLENGRKKLVNYNQLDTRELTKQILALYPNTPERENTYCPAGFEYVYITPSLNVYTCIPYQKRRNGYLGNCLKRTVRLRDRPMLCELSHCYCVPGR